VEEARQFSTAANVQCARRPPPRPCATNLQCVASSQAPSDVAAIEAADAAPDPAPDEPTTFFEVDRPHRPPPGSFGPCSTLLLSHSFAFTYGTASYSPPACLAAAGDLPRRPRVAHRLPRRPVRPHLRRVAGRRGAVISCPVNNMKIRKFCSRHFLYNVVHFFKISCTPDIFLLSSGEPNLFFP
jgi:hypothetical protein